MTTINKNQIKSVIDENQKLKNDLISLQKQQYDLEYRLNQIYSAKSYKLWQKYTRIKEIIINYLKIKFSYLKKIPNPIKKFLKFIYFKYLEVNLIFKITAIKYFFLVKNNVKDPKVSILIPTYGSTTNLTRILKSIQKYPDNIKYEILICNDNPFLTEKVVSWIKNNKKLIKDLNITILSGTKNIGFVGTINKLAKISKGEYLFLLNDDTEVINNNWLSSLIEPFSDTKIGATGSFLIFPNTNLVQHAGMYPYKKMDGKIYNYHYFKFFNKNYPEIKSKFVPMVTGAALLIQKKLFFDLKMLDYHYLGAGGFDDSDLCNKIINNGKKIMFVKESIIIHYEGLTINSTDKKTKGLILQHNQDYYLKKWTKLISDKYPEYV